MFLREWFKKKLSVPLFIGFVFIFSVQFIIVFYSRKQDLKNQDFLLNFVQTMVSKGIYLHDRQLIDSIFSIELNQIRATNFSLFYKKKILISQGESYLREENDYSLLNNRYKRCKKIFGMKDYEVCASFRLFEINDGFVLIVVSAFVLMFLILFFIFKIKRDINNDIILPIMHSISLKSDDIHYKIQEIEDIYQNKRNIIKLEEQNKIFQEKSKLARQVAHDIRSPLAALNMAISGSLDGLPESDRVIIRGQINRIHDIANNLIIKSKPSFKNEVDSLDKNDLSVELLTSIISFIATEKRLCFRSNINISITDDIYGEESYGLFVSINTREFKRILSNLINNSIDAFDDKKGDVCLLVKEKIHNEQDFVQIIVKDNGKGIPDSIIHKLGTEGMSYGKENSQESGSGLGLYHACKEVRSWGGFIEIESVVGQGTSMIINLPKKTPPKWFVPFLSLHANQTVVILDDDQGIHLTWENRFKDLNLKKSCINVIHFSTPYDFSTWIEKEKNHYENVLFLCDYELIGFEEKGLDIIEKYKLNNAILVTSHYENDEIRNKCSLLGVRLIPKMLSGFVPIKIVSDNKIKIFDSVYIDDDSFLRMLWKKTAEKNNVNLLVLDSTKEFHTYEQHLSKDLTNIYLDNDLGENEMTGMDFSKILYKEGFKNIFMASGQEASYFSDLPWVKHVSKDYPLTVKGKF